MDAEHLFIEEFGVIIARRERQTEELRVHGEGKNHTYKGEVTRENARLKQMLRQLHYLKNLKELYDATRVTDPISNFFRSRTGTRLSVADRQYRTRKPIHRS